MGMAAFSNGLFVDERIFILTGTATFIYLGCFDQ